MPGNYCGFVRRGVSCLVHTELFNEHSNEAEQSTSWLCRAADALQLQLKPIRPHIRDRCTEGQLRPWASRPVLYQMAHVAAHI